VANSDEPVEPDGVDDLVVARARSLDGRKWLEVIVKIVEAYGREPGRHELVQCELDTLVVAACERAKRILRSDLDPSGRSG
jgi:hypothetical protein